MVAAKGKSFVTAIEPPEFETTLHFSAPKQAYDKQIATASEAPAKQIR